MVAAAFDPGNTVQCIDIIIVTLLVGNYCCKTSWHSWNEHKDSDHTIM